MLKGVRTEKERRSEREREIVTRVKLIKYNSVCVYVISDKLLQNLVVYKIRHQHHHHYHHHQQQQHFCQLLGFIMVYPSVLSCLRTSFCVGASSFDLIFSISLSTGTFPFLSLSSHLSFLSLHSSESPF